MLKISLGKAGLEAEKRSERVRFRIDPAIFQNPSEERVWREGCLFNYVSSSLFIATNAPHPFLFSFLRYDAGGWRYYANAATGKIGAVLFAGCVAGVEGESKDVETECCAKSLTRSLRTCDISIITAK